MERNAFWFQSSPGPKAGCYSGMNKTEQATTMFQSSPGPKAGCYYLTEDTSDLHRSGFNPHPARKPDATIAGSMGKSYRSVVSILTRPESRMLHSQAAMPRSSKTSFNPHPARKPDATAPGREERNAPSGFNPHPARKPDATPPPPPATTPTLVVSILTRPESRMLQAQKAQTATRTKVSILTRPESRMLPPGSAA